MPGWPPSTQSGDRHDRVDGPPRWPKPRRRVGRGHEPRDFVPRLARCSVFKDRFAPARRDSPGRHDPPRRRPASIAATLAQGSPAASRQPLRATRQALVAALADLQHLAVELGGRARRAARPPAPLPPIRTPPGRSGGAPRCELRPKCSASSAGRWTAPFGPLGLHHRLLDVVRDLAAHVQLVEALPRRPRPRRRRGSAPPAAGRARAWPRPGAGPGSSSAPSSSR